MTTSLSLRVSLAAAVLIGAVVISMAAMKGCAAGGSAAPALDELETIAGVPFEAVVVDDLSGDNKMAGDIDGDGLADLVLAGMPNEGLVWYRYPDWRATRIATPRVEFTTDGALGDVDGDGDLDIVTPDGPSGENLLWFENPRPGADPGDAGAWSRHVVGAIGDWGKDVELGDFDADGRLDMATRSPQDALIFFQEAGGSWAPTVLRDAPLGEEGMASGDIDGDGALDLVVRGAWVENPGAGAARDPGGWRPHWIGDVDPTFKALVTDLDDDGRADVLFSSSEGTSDLVRFVQAEDDPRGAWQRQVLLSDVERAHTLQAGDIDADGDTDVLVAQMHTSAARRIAVLYNLDGRAHRWASQIVDRSGLHNGVLVDLGGDGDLDVYGANWVGNPPVRAWINHLDPPPDRIRLDRWRYIQVADTSTRTFGLAFGDVDQDGRIDIVAGDAWWRNPGGDLTGTWVRTALPAGTSVIAMVDVDGDSDSDLIAQAGGDPSQPLQLLWLEAEDQAAQVWRSTAVGEVPAASHAEGAQGYRIAQLEPGGRPEVMISSGGGVFSFRIPDQPLSGAWPRVSIAPGASDEGFAVGDVDGDGLLDVAATGGETKLVAWYRNPGSGGGGWTEHRVGRFESAVYPDRTELLDWDGDGRLDIVVSEENGADSEAEVRWWRAPEVATANGWPSEVLITGGSFNSMDAADLDHDGDLDLAVAEHRGAKDLYILNNLGGGRVMPQLVSSGRESHLGARLVDLDGDGDHEIVSIAWDTPNLIHLWRNDGKVDGGLR